MNIFITGASGFIGQHILQACLDHGYQVTACIRHPNDLQRYYPSVRTLQGDFTKDHDDYVWLPRVTGVDVVVNAVGVFRQNRYDTFEFLHTTAACALFKACERAHVKKIIQISALGADNSAFSKYHLSKKAADDRLSQLNLDWVILQPSIVYGPGAKSMRLFQALAALPCTPLVDDGNQLIQPIHIDDLTKAVITSIESDTIRHQRIAAVGPESISMKSLYSVLKRWQGESNDWFVNIPHWLAVPTAHLGSLSGTSSINADAVKMLRKGNTASVRPFVSTFGFTPRGFQQTLFHKPPLQSELLDARLYFLLPLLKISLALLWLATGFISAFGYPLESSYAMLHQVGIPTPLMPVALYGAASLDVILGIGLLVSYQLRAVLALQILTIIIYSLIITVNLPELWLHPFGPVTKNIPLLVITWVLLRLEK